MRPFMRPNTPLPNYPPKTMYRGNKLPLIKDMITFIRLHRFGDYRSKEYINSPRSNYYRPHWEVRHRLWPRHIPDLAAINAQERIRFVKIAMRHATSHPGLQSEPLFWVTITSPKHVCPLADGASFDLKPFKAYMRQALTGLNFIGFTDVALFKRQGSAVPLPSDLLSWHFHGIVWGATRKEVNAVLEDARKSGSIIPGGRSVVVIEITQDELVEKLLYAMKGPQREYNIRRELKRELRERLEDGVIATYFRVQKRPLRTGDRVRLHEVLRDFYLDQMLFGGRDGSSLVAAINEEALKPFRLDELRTSLRTPKRRRPRPLT